MADKDIAQVFLGRIRLGYQYAVFVVGKVVAFGQAWLDVSQVIGLAVFGHHNTTECCH